MDTFEAMASLQSSQQGKAEPESRELNPLDEFMERFMKDSCQGVPAHASGFCGFRDFDEFTDMLHEAACYKLSQNDIVEHDIVGLSEVPLQVSRRVKFERMIEDIGSTWAFNHGQNDAYLDYEVLQFRQALSKQETLFIDMNSFRQEDMYSQQFNPLEEMAASISLSSFGAAFRFDAFNSWFKKKKSMYENDTSKSNLLSFMAKPFKPSSASISCKCPPAIVAARAATPVAKNAIPTSHMLAMGLMGIAANVPLGMWRQHTQTFSPSWFTAVLGGVPFVHVLYKSASMPNTMASTVGTCILGQIIGGMAERNRLTAMSATPLPPPPPPETGRPEDVFYFQLGKSSWSILVKVSSLEYSITFSIRGHSFTYTRPRALRNSSPSASLGPTV